MNKKIKMIELLNKIANGELKNNTKFNIINEDGDIIKCKYSSTYPGYIWVIDNEEVSFNYKIDYLRILSYEVEILEDKIDSIEKIKTLKYDTFNKKQKSLYENMVTLANKLNEVIDKINEMENNK